MLIRGMGQALFWVFSHGILRSVLFDPDVVGEQAGTEVSVVLSGMGAGAYVISCCTKGTLPHCLFVWAQCLGA